MPPPKDLPGFYFDPEKNRYFPTKPPIPGSNRPSSSSAPPNPNKDDSLKKEIRKNVKRTLELLHCRELGGVVSGRRRYDFEQEFEKLQASHPMVWKYQRTNCVADTALEQMHGIIQTQTGLKEACLLSTGSSNGSISLYEVGKVGQYLDSGFRCMPQPVWPNRMNYEAGHTAGLGSIWSSSEASTSFTSSISCVRRIGRHSLDIADGASSFHRALVTTLGSGVSGGSVYILNLTQPLDFASSSRCLHRRASKIATFDCTIWTGDCSCNGTKAVIGTNKGAALIDIESGTSSWVYRTKSDIFSQQFDQSGNIVLCGLRNGAIIAVDVRQKQSQCLQVSSRPPTVPSSHKVVRASRVRRDTRHTKQRFEIKKTSASSSNPCMSSAVCSLVALQSDDQYFLGSSMDGSIKLFDRRLLHRGAIQTYEGHVNSHSHLQLGVNPLETLVVSGGEDCYVRIWSIKSSKLIFEENVSNSIFMKVCWPQGIHGLLRQMHYYEENPFELYHSWGLWLGSHEGLFHMYGT